MSDPSKVTIDAPDVAPAKGGLLDVANVTTTTGLELLYGVRYTPLLEGKNLPVPTDGSDKVFATEGNNTESVKFSAYRGVDVSIMRHHGLGPALVQTAFTASESYGVERNIQELLLNPVAQDVLGAPAGWLNSAARRLNIGVLEQFAADNYSGLPLISGNKLAISLIADQLVERDGKLFTILGTPVVACGGYGNTGPVGVDMAGPHTALLYVSGQINIWQGNLLVVEGPALQKNRELALAERSYTATVDGPVGYLVTTS